MRLSSSSRIFARARRLALALGFTVAGFASPGSALTGVCPDGSVFIVRDPAQIPCPDAKQVNPHEVPPLRPEYLPTPYTWQVYNEAQNPNNPYNLVDTAREIRAMNGQSSGAAPETPSARGAARPGATGQAEAFAADSVSPLDLGLSDDELQDLYLIVDFSQERSPARFVRETADGRGVFEVSFAHSQAFDERLRESWRSRGGIGDAEILLFTALSKRPESFYANFTVVQGHLSFQPDVTNARQLGVLQGRLGSLGADELVLGYLILPETMSLSEPLDLYWNDRRITAQF